MLRQAEIGGAIEEEEQDMIENVLEIKDTYVREVMTPLVDVVAIDVDATLMEFRNLWIKHQYSRVPVYERRVDNIIGIAYAMDIIDYMGDEVKQMELLERLTVGRIAHKPAYFVPDSMSVWNLLREFRIRKVHMAIVLNEYGGTVGLVTLEDVVEEIVGEIFDENDSKEEIRKKTGYVVQRADGIYDVDANTSIEELAQSLEVIIPEGPFHYETVSGFVCETFGYIPRTGESCTIDLKSAERSTSDRDEDHREKDHRRDTERDRDSERTDERRQQLLRFRVEILAGNARKVSSVRIERLNKTENGSSPLRADATRDDRPPSTRVGASARRGGRDESERATEARAAGGGEALVRVVDAKKWIAMEKEGGEESCEGEVEGRKRGSTAGEMSRGEGVRGGGRVEEEGRESEELTTDSDDERSDDERDDIGGGSYAGGRRWRPFAEGVDVTSREEESSGSYRRVEEGHRDNGSRREWVRGDMANSDSSENPRGSGVEEEEEDVGGANGTASAPWRWEEKVKQVDRRRQRRMKQSVEAAAELNRQQRRPDERVRRGIHIGPNSKIAAYVVARRRIDLTDQSEEGADTHGSDGRILHNGNGSGNGYVKDDGSAEIRS